MTQESRNEGTRDVKTFCRVCEPACGMVAEVRDDTLIRLRADTEHPVSKGFVCNKGIYGADLHNDPDRLKWPLKRVGPGQFERVTWSDALDDIARRLAAIKDEHGPESLGSYTGNPTAFNALFGPGFGNFAGGFGFRKNFSSGTQDCSNKFAGSEAVFGTRTCHPVPDIDNSDFILLIGENPAVSHMSFVSLPNPMAHLKEAQARGARIVYVNPRRIESARHAGEVMLVKPDTDVYLLAALLEEIHSSVGFSSDVDLHGRGVAELIDFVSHYPAERVADVIGVPADDIRQMARDFASAGSACAHLSTGVNMGRQGTLAYWLLHMLVFVTGNLGKRGGNFYGEGFYARSVQAGKRVPAGYLDTPFGQVRKPGGVGISLPGNLMANYITDAHEPIRALMVNSGNPMLSMGGESVMAEALESLELLVVVDIYRNATAEYADYVLPAAGAYEREDINITGLGLQVTPSIQFTPAIVSPGFERKPEWWIFDELAERLGLARMNDPDNPQVWARTDAMLRSKGRSMDELREEGVLVFEVAEPERFYSDFLQHDDARVDCYPDSFVDAIERMALLFDELSNEPASTLKLISKRDAYMLNSWYSNLDKLKRRDRDRNYLFMAPRDAEERQLSDGQRVRVSNVFGELETQIKITDELRDGVVAMTHGWGHRASPGMTTAHAKPGANPNRLLPTGPGSFEPLSNQAHMTGVPVEVSAA